MSFALDWTAFQKSAQDLPGQLKQMINELLSKHASTEHEPVSVSAQLCKLDFGTQVRFWLPTLRITRV